MGFDIKWERIQDILVAIVLGRIDGSNAEEFQRALDAGLESDDRTLLLDFGRVVYISSAGLRVCLAMARQFNDPDKRFGLCTASDPVLEVFTISGFDKIISIYETRDAAVGEMNAQ